MKGGCVVHDNKEPHWVPKREVNLPGVRTRHVKSHPHPPAGPRRALIMHPACGMVIRWTILKGTWAHGHGPCWGGGQMDAKTRQTGEAKFCTGKVLH